jgi:hypothetical protein
MGIALGAGALFLIILSMSLSGRKRLKKLEETDPEYKKYIEDKFNL